MPIPSFPPVLPVNSFVIRNPYKGKRETPKGFMPLDKVIRHRLSDNTPGESGFADTRMRHHSSDKALKHSIEQVKMYRLTCHNAYENGRLPKSLRMAVQYLSVPLSKYSERDSNNEGSNRGKQGELV